MEIFVFAIFIGILPAAIAHGKGRSFILWWFYGTMLFIIALPISICLKPKEEFTMRRCPRCDEYIQPNAQICKHCKSEITALTSAQKDILEKHAKEQVKKDSNVF